MNVISTLVIGGLVAATPYFRAQQPDTSSPPLYPGTHTYVPGVYITPIAGEPFVATVEIKTDVVATDGTWSTRHTMNRIARDSSGRIRNERRALVPESFRGEPRVLEVHLFDPQTRLNTFFTPATHIATERVLPEMPKGPRPASPGAKVQDLGTTMISDVETSGLRYTFLVPAQSSGTGNAVEVTDEYWYSQELGINILVTHHDPRTGLQTVAITSLSREEPPASLFEVPPGFKVVDLTPPTP
jgi:hypothetical protein